MLLLSSDWAPWGKDQKDQDMHSFTKRTHSELNDQADHRLGKRYAYPLVKQTRTTPPGDQSESRRRDLSAFSGLGACRR